MNDESLEQPFAGNHVLSVATDSSSSPPSFTEPNNNPFMSKSVQDSVEKIIGTINEQKRAINQHYSRIIWALVNNAGGTMRIDALQLADVPDDWVLDQWMEPETSVYVIRARRKSQAPLS